MAFEHPVLYIANDKDDDKDMLVLVLSLNLDVVNVQWNVYRGLEDLTVSFLLYYSVKKCLANKPDQHWLSLLWWVYKTVCCVTTRKYVHT